MVGVLANDPPTAALRLVKNRLAGKRTREGEISETVARSGQCPRGDGLNCRAFSQHDAFAPFEAV